MTLDTIDTRTPAEQIAAKKLRKAMEAVAAGPLISALSFNTFSGPAALNRLMRLASPKRRRAARTA